MQIVLRPALIQDFDFCRTLYFAGMEEVIRELNLDRDAQAIGFRKQWSFEEARITTVDGGDIGWMQSTLKDGAIFLGQLFIDSGFQRRGIGTEVIGRLIEEAGDLPVTLSVAKINPAVRLYERFGFRITHEDGRKFHMRREPGALTPLIS